MGEGPSVEQGSSPTTYLRGLLEVDCLGHSAALVLGCDPAFSLVCRVRCIIAARTTEKMG